MRWSYPLSRNITSVAACVLAACALGQPPEPPSKAGGQEGGAAVRLGNFSVSLAVKDIAASQAFYEKLGFHPVFRPGKSIVIMQNENCTIGLFQGQFEKNILTFNPGWDRSMKTLSDFDDVREIQRRLKKAGITPSVAAEESTTGPAGFTVYDPDGNQILIDQHVASPKK
jgi:catechol 2,3-dioxygenase-like lactoylglutathione lyase family enzyme